MRTALWIPVAAAAGLAVAAALGTAGAQEEVRRAAHFAGVDGGKGAAPELVLFNTTGTPMTLDLKLVDPEGNVLVDRADEIELGFQQTAFVDLAEQLRRDLPRNVKPYRGSFAVVVSGGPPFDASTVVGHVAQYYGARARPKAAFVLQPLFRDE